MHFSVRLNSATLDLYNGCKNIEFYVPQSYASYFQLPGTRDLVVQTAPALKASSSLSATDILLQSLRFILL